MTQNLTRLGLCAINMKDILPIILMLYDVTVRIYTVTVCKNTFGASEVILYFDLIHSFTLTKEPNPSQR